jgi:MFS family permease
MVRKPPYASSPRKNRMLRPLLINRDFQLLSLSEGLWLLGSQFYFIALPWLVMQFTSSVATLGAVYALAALPRLSLTALGGALCDRISLKTLMLLATITRTLYLTLLAWYVLSRNISIGLLFAFAFSYGVMEAFFHPARRTAVPRLASNNLQVANAFTYGLEQLMGFAGPALAGWAVAYFSFSKSEIHGIGVAFGVDALLTLGAVIAISFMTNIKPTTAQKIRHEDNFIGSIKQGIVHAWLHKDTRITLLMLATLNLFVVSPVLLGLPVLADARLTGGSATLGLLSSCFAGGALFGTVLAGALPKPELERKMTIVMLVFGLCLLNIGLLFTTDSRPLAALSVFTVGLLVSYLNVITTIWLQHCTPPHLMGRMMGLLATK